MVSRTCSGPRSQIDPRTNLDIQTAVISGSRGFIGTCGSLAWLAPMLGIDTVAVYANDRFLASHIFFATHVYRQNGAAQFDTLDLRGVMDVDLMAASESTGRRRQTAMTNGVGDGVLPVMPNGHRSSAATRFRRFVPAPVRGVAARDGCAAKSVTGSSGISSCSHATVARFCSARGSAR